ncbi:hypothetical protein GCM10023405_10130 [Streptomonospora salina]
MSLVVAALTALVRLCRRSHGLHARPLVLRDERPAARLEAASAADRAAPGPVAASVTRIRPYVPRTAPADSAPIPADASDSSRMIRPYLVAAEHRREAQRTARVDATRLGVCVLQDIAATAGAAS